MTVERVSLEDFNSIPSRELAFDPSDLEALLDATRDFIRRFVVVTEAQADSLALWAAHTHVVDAFETTPYLAITSAEKRCGKSRVFDVLELLVARPWRAITPSEAVLFRKIETQRPTLLFDEIDAIFSPRSNANGSTEPLRALLNAGNRQGTTVPRCVGPAQSLVDFRVFCAKALAGIGSLPETVSDRAISLRMVRKAPGETVDRFRRREAVELAAPIVAGLAVWADASREALATARPVIPSQLDDRAEEAWEPLLAIAEQAGPEWAQRGHRAAMELATGEVRDDPSLGVRVLQDCRAAFDRTGAEKLSTAQLINLLAEDEEAPWGDWHGAPIKPTKLSRLLKPFGIRSKTIRLGDETAKGYARADFEDAWMRYLPSSPENGGLAVTSVTTASLSQESILSLAAEPSHVTAPSLGVTAGEQPQVAAIPHEHSDVTDVTDKGPSERHNGDEDGPLPGDDGFADFLVAAIEAGHITQTEGRNCHDLHEQILRGRLFEESRGS